MRSSKSIAMTGLLARASLVLILIQQASGQLAEAGSPQAQSETPPPSDVNALNSTLPTWITVPAGKFMMGGQVSAERITKDFEAYGRPPEYFSDEYPQHLVQITKPFMMATTEVTVGQFRQFINETGYRPSSEVDGTGAWGYDKQLGKCRGRDPRFSWAETGYPQTDSFPVVNVTYDDCRAYCKWLAKKIGRIVRLPTEAEWEYACRAGTSSYYWMGNDSDRLTEQSRTLKPTPGSIRKAVQNLQIAEDSSNSFPVAVGSYQPNAFGLYDMHGNVWEWTADWYDENYYSKSPMKDPQGPVQGEVRVRRGGGWNTFPLWARASFRNWNSPDSRCLNLGFRVVAELTAVELADYHERQPISITFVGDIMLDGGPGHYIASGKDPFSKCARLLTSSDLTIGNLECVLGRGGDQVLKTYNFRGARNSEKYLRKYFHAVSLANNHAFDFGPDGLTECISVLKQADIGYFGAGKDSAKARSGLAMECKGRRILFLGYNEFRKENYRPSDTTAGVNPLDEESAIEDIRKAKADGKFDIVIPYLHWGYEMMTQPTEDQRRLAKRMIDAGASAIIGTHPHVTQTVDVYKGAPIIYSLGNFTFDYFPVDPPLWNAWTVQLSIAADGKVDFELTAIAINEAGIPYPADSE